MMNERAGKKREKKKRRIRMWEMEDGGITEGVMRG